MPERHERLRAMKFYVSSSERRSLRRQAADEDRTVTAIVRTALGFGEPGAPRARRCHGRPARTDEKESATT
jgi:hypothetical protein